MLILFGIIAYLVYCIHSTDEDFNNTRLKGIFCGVLWPAYLGFLLARRYYESRV
jgi:hypothetical protein